MYVILITFLGPEYLGRDFHVENDEDVAIVAGSHHNHDLDTVGSSDDGKGNGHDMTKTV